MEAYFGLEQQLVQSIGATVDLVMASALRNPIVRAEIEASKQLIDAADAIAQAVHGISV